jgi:hypothetical protein
MLVAVFESQVKTINMGAPALPDTYQCNSSDTPCVCPYDSTHYQTFETHQQYKNHMLNIHGELAYTKRKNTKPVTEETKAKKRLATLKLHDEGTFKNTHVKRETLLEFVNTYDRFLDDLFKSNEYDGGEYKRKWQHYFRVRGRDLEERSLEELIKDMNRGHLSGYAMDRLKWAQRALEEEYY